MRVFLLIAAMTLATPAFAETPLPPNAPASKDGKTDFTKPFINDRLGQPLPPKQPPDHPHVELNAGPGPINR
ncbi:MAG TPA: hypothetical protein VN175_06910 [Rhizomicrobium sp.]|nr:hypothetical protein [Rhizomicrobium sp.]